MTNWLYQALLILIVLLHINGECKMMDIFTHYSISKHGNEQNIHECICNEFWLSSLCCYDEIQQNISLYIFYLLFYYKMHDPKFLMGFPVGRKRKVNEKDRDRKKSHGVLPQFWIHHPFLPKPQVSYMQATEDS